MKRMCVNVLLVALCLSVIPGCGDKPDSPQEAPPEVTTPKEVSTPPVIVEIKPDSPQETPRKADTPRQVLENMRLAILAGDKQAFVNCFEATGKSAETVDAFYEFSSAAGQFDKAMRKVYGDEAVTKAMGSSDKAVPFEDDKWLEDLTVQIEGDTATASKDGQGKDLSLVKKDGLWKINAKSMLAEKGASDQDIEQLTSMFQLMAKVITDVSRKVGQDGYSAEKINQELRQAMMMAMMQAAGAQNLPVE